MPITLIAVSKATLVKAQQLILGCEACSQEAEIPFDWLLDDVTGYDGSEVDYVLSEAARYPRGLGEVVEKTLVEQLILSVTARVRFLDGHDVPKSRGRSQVDDAFSRGMALVRSPLFKPVEVSPNVA